MPITDNDTLLNQRKIDMFLDCTLSKLGLNHANLGTRYFKEMIKSAYYDDMIDIKYKELCMVLGEKLGLPSKKVDSNIYNSIISINVNLAKKNFQDVFHIDFDYFYLSPKKLIILFLNVLNYNFNSN